MDQSQEDKENYISDFRMKIGQSIKEAREKRGYSQDELAEIMEVNRTTISKIENGKFAITIDYLAKFAWHLAFDFSIIKV